MTVHNVCVGGGGGGDVLMAQTDRHESVNEHENSNDSTNIFNIIDCNIEISK